MNVARDIAGVLRRDEPMARHTSWRVGGPADLYFKPASADDLALFLAGLEPGIEVYWVGLGSNLLVRDGGLRGAVISTHRVFDSIERAGAGAVRVGAGAACAKLARSCQRAGLGRAAFFAGIPGTVGGALAMNAGAFGGETWDHVTAVDVIDRQGARRRRGRDEYEIGYRSVSGPPGEWFLSASMHFEADPSADKEAIRALLTQRKLTQPIGAPSCGSVFRNPPGDHAARLIEAAGLKGTARGGARVSEKHANFIINEGGASAADIEALIDFVRATVDDVYGIRLVTEVRILGERADD